MATLWSNKPTMNQQAPLCQASSSVMAASYPKSIVAPDKKLRLPEAAGMFRPRTITFEDCHIVLASTNYPNTEGASQLAAPREVSVTSETSVASLDDASTCKEITGNAQKENSQEALKQELSVNHSQGLPLPELNRKRSHPEIDATKSIRLLTEAGDENVLNPLHAFIRRQIEVFTATHKEMQQPAPGRKNPIHLNQVGLRCIHCCHLPHKVKRAVCYPSTVGRIYHAVSDMKFDHFNHCKGLPADVKAQLDLIKQGMGRKCKKDDAKATFTSTAQYYHDSAVRMGMVDGRGGVFFLGSSNKHAFFEAQELPEVVTEQPLVKKPKLSASQESSIINPVSMLQIMGQLSAYTGVTPNLATFIPKQEISLPPEAPKTPSVRRMKHSVKLPIKKRKTVPTPKVEDAPEKNQQQQAYVLLATLKDREHLSDIHCFVRKQIGVFAADAANVSAPAPGRRTRIVQGQVGIRCIHCAHLPPRNRRKRSVCYPPSIKGIYHAVSNMKFDHFSVCQSLPPDVKSEFDSLYSTERSRSTRSRGTEGTRSSSMIQYYLDSASTLGLRDTESGIRFVDASFEPKARRDEDRDSLTGISALMVAATDLTSRADGKTRKNEATPKEY